MGQENDDSVHWRPSDKEDAVIDRGCSGRSGSRDRFRLSHFAPCSRSTLPKDTYSHNTPFPLHQQQSKNHTNRNQSFKAHRNGIKKPKNYVHKSLKGVRWNGGNFMHCSKDWFVRADVRAPPFEQMSPSQSPTPLSIDPCPADDSLII